MKNKFVLLIILFSILVNFGCVNKKSFSNIKLSENWTFRNVNTENWYPAQVPGHIHTDLLKNDLISDPFLGMNELELQWIENEDWEYLAQFNINPDFLNHDKIEITFEGLDTYADIFLNESLIHRSDNMFIPWVVSVKPFLKEGKNILKVYFHSPVKKGQNSLEVHPHLIPASNEAKPIGHQTSVFTRKAQYHFGWDWGPRLVTSGIWRPITLNGWDIAKIKDVYYHLDSLSLSSANYNIELSIESIKNIDTEITIHLNNKTTSHKVYLKSGMNILKINDKIMFPELWWPNGLGNQKLYEAEIILTANSQIIDRITNKIGVRKIEVMQQPDSQGSSFYFRVNDIPVFMKGANYIPGDFFNVRASKRYEEVIQNAVEANMNMLRVWGGAVYENDEFYNFCDQKGILVWQDFMFACCMVPGGKHIQNIEREAIENIKRLRNHPSLALWCGNNESLTGWKEWNWQNLYSLHGKDSVDVWKNYEKVFHEILPNAVDSLDPGKFYWSSSASSEFGKLQNKSKGDQHEWGVWFGQMPFSRYEKNAGRFISEYGLQSLPEITTVQKMDTTISKWTLKTQALKFRQRSKMPWIEEKFDGFDMMEHYIKLYYPSPDNLEEFIYLSQLTQALGLKTAIHSHRRNKPYTMGSLYWQIDDVWPTVSWSTVDYFGKWKAAHYEVKKAFEPILITSSITDTIVTITIINDELDSISGNLFIDVFTFNGNRIYSTDLQLEIEPNSTTVSYSKTMEELLCGQEKNKVFLYAYIESNGENIAKNNFYFTKPKFLLLVSPKITTSTSKLDNKWEFSLLSTTLAKDVFLSIEGVEGSWSNNYFDLLPGREKTVTFKTNLKIETDKPKLNILTLEDVFD